MTECVLCRSPQCGELVDFGPQPVCHHFFDGGRPEDRHPMVLGQCGNCGLVQLTRRIPPEQLLPRFDWLVNNEPEGHVDALVKSLRELPGIVPGANICGVSHKDESTLRRFREQGFDKVWRMDSAQDLGMTSPREGIETIQQRVRPHLVEGLHRKYGVPDLIIARHVLEHTHDPGAFMETLRRLVKPGGYVVFEIPDCAMPFDLLDYTAMWEDHTLYLNEHSLRMCVAAGGLPALRVDSYPAPYEICVVAITQPGAAAVTKCPPEEQQRAERFARSFGPRRKALKELLAAWKQEGAIALFGAGHHAAMFTNLMDVAGLMEFVLDDHPRKKGLQMPGSRLPIVGSENLMRGNISLCLSSLGFGSERKVMAKHQDFIESGGTFASIFPVNPGEMLTVLAGPAMPAGQTRTL